MGLSWPPVASHWRYTRNATWASSAAYNSWLLERRGNDQLVVEIFFDFCSFRPKNKRVNLLV